MKSSSASDYIKNSLVLLIIAITVTALLLGFTAACVSAAEIEFTVLHTNDEHSHLIPHTPTMDRQLPPAEDGSRGGMARLAGAVGEIEEELGANRPLFLLNGGDFIGANPFSWLVPAGAGAELNLMQEIGYDAAVYGNHEFDYGVEILREYMDAAGYPEAGEKLPVLGSNIDAGAEEEVSPYIRENRILEIEDDLKLGLMGLIGEDAARIAPDTGGLSFETPPEAAEDQVEILKEDGADVIAALTHAGLEEDRDLARAIDGLDIIVGGHSHDLLREPELVGGTLIVQAGAYLSHLGRLDLSYDRAEEDLTVENYELIELDSEVQPAADIEKKVSDYEEMLSVLVEEISGGEFAGSGDPILRSEFALEKEPYAGENPVGNFVTDAMRLEAERVLGESVDIAFQGSGQIRADLYPGGPDSELSFYDLAATSAFGTGPGDDYGFPLVTAYLRGDELMTLLEVAAFIPRVETDRHFIHFSGLRYSYDPENAVLFTVPGIEFPVLPMRAVADAEIYRGEGRQPPGGVGSATDGEYIKPEEDELYRMVTDAHMLSQISLVEDIIPWANLAPRDEDGNRLDVDNLEQFLIETEEGNLKTWQTVVGYGRRLEEKEGGMPNYYSQKGGRIEEVDAASQLAIFIAAVIVISSLMVILLKLVLNRRKSG